MTTCTVPLPAIPAAESITASLPEHIERALSVNWDLLDAPDWECRAAALDMLLHLSMQNMERGAADWQFQLESVARLVTSLLEQLAEREIGCIAQAALYRLSAHPGWQAAASRWMQQAEGSVDARAWMHAHPGIGLLLLRRMSAEIVP